MSTLDMLNGFKSSESRHIYTGTYVRKGICEHINEQITGSKDIPDNVNGTSMNDISSGGIMGGANKVGHPGRQFLCEKTVDGYYYYYHVLVEQ